jgi:AraC-like DNA-binding protein
MVVAGLCNGLSRKETVSAPHSELHGPRRAQVVTSWAVSARECSLLLFDMASPWPSRALSQNLSRPPPPVDSLASQASEMTSIRELQIWIAEHLQTKLSVEDLADRMSMSVRNFERVFTREVGTTPSQYASDARGGSASSARTHRERAQAGGFGRRIRKRRRDEAHLHTAVGDHPTPLSQVRRPFDRRMKAGRLVRLA